MAEIYGIPIPDLPDGSIPVDVVLLCKWVDVDGKVKYSEMKSSSLHNVEALGMVTTAADTLRSMCMNPERPDA